MARDAFLIRLDPKVLNAVKRWAEDELRSTNGQIEYLLRRALREAGRDPNQSDSSESQAKEDSQDAAQDDP